MLLLNVVYYKSDYVDHYNWYTRMIQLGSFDYKVETQIINLN